MALFNNIKFKKTYRWLNDFGYNEVIEKEKEYNAYIRIESVEGNKENMKICVVYYENDSAKKILQRKYYTFVPTMDDKNFIKQGYEFLKTLPKFINAVDC